MEKKTTTTYQTMTLKQKKTFNKNHYQTSCKKRRNERKRKLVEEFGGKCSICGYEDNLHNLQFHHINPDLKKFEVGSKNLSSKTWNKILEEAKKCKLVCSHCHTDIHCPQGKNWKNK